MILFPTWILTGLQDIHLGFQRSRQICGRWISIPAGRASCCRYYTLGRPKCELARATPRETHGRWSRSGQKRTCPWGKGYKTLIIQLINFTVKQYNSTLREISNCLRGNAQSPTIGSCRHSLPRGSVFCTNRDSSKSTNGSTYFPPSWICNYFAFDYVFLVL